MTILRTSCIFLALTGCDMLGPRVSDETIDAPRGPDASVDTPAGPKYVLPATAVVPSIADNTALAGQIQVFDGLNDGTLAANGGVHKRSTGKAGGATVLYWSFGSALLVDGFVASAPLYMLADSDGSGGYTPRTDHPWIIDSIPGDQRYSAIRRLIYVPVTGKYAGERITSVEALQEALELGLVSDPVPATVPGVTPALGTWRNMPVVAAGTKLEVSTGVSIDTTEVYGRGYRIGLFPLGGTLGIQPLRNNSPPLGQESRLISGVLNNGVQSTTLDAQPVFQFGIPAAPPTTAFNYTPIVTELDVRLASGIAPSAVNNDTQMFTRAGGAINGYDTAVVDNYTVTTTISNKQIQFVDGEP